MKLLDGLDGIRDLGPKDVNDGNLLGAGHIIWGHELLQSKGLELCKRLIQKGQDTG